jgi:hypothetical protein
MNEENKATPGSPTPAPAQANPMQKEIEKFLPQNLEKKTTQNQNGDAVTIPQVEKLDPNLVQKPIRTYESDLAEALAKKQGGSTAISLAENKKKFEEQRKAEGVPVPQPRPLSPGARPINPTQATAIPGATIDLQPEMPKSQVQFTPPTQVIRPKITPVPPLNVPTPPRVVPVQKPAPLVSPVQVPQQQVMPEAPRRSFLKPFLLTIISVVFIGAGIFEGYLLYTKMQANKAPVVLNEPIVIPSVLPKDKQISLTIGSEKGNNLVTKIYGELTKQSAPTGKIIELRLFEQDAATTKYVAASSFIDKLNTHMPDVITRSLTDRWMLGLFGEETGQQTTFLALTTDFFQNAFAGMLAWEERSMADDLALLLNFKDRAKKDEIASSTVSSYFGINGRFSDKTIRNRDVREFRSLSGDLLFLYSFINKETLLITTTESSFIALVDRIEKDAYVR